LNYTLIFDIGSPMYLANEGLAGGGVSACDVSWHERTRRQVLAE
jgi:hypothetical protein